MCVCQKFSNEVVKCSMVKSVKPSVEFISVYVHKNFIIYLSRNINSRTKILRTDSIYSDI